MRLFSSPPSVEPPLLWLNTNDGITMHQAYEGFFGIGANGSGKSSTLAHLMLALMCRGAGMLILTAAVEDYAQMARIAKKAGREHDLRRFAPDERWRFDFLQHELSSPGGSISAASQVMQDLVDFGTKTQSQNSSESFFPLASTRQIRMAMTVIYAAKGQCSVGDVYKFVTTMPTSPMEVATPEFRTSFCGECLLLAHANLSPDVDLAGDFVLKEWPRLGDRTGGSIQANTMNVLEKFMHGNVRELIASGVTNISPQDVLDGRIVVIDLPVLRYREPGQFVQIIWKLLTQRAAMRRQHADRDVVLWADEAQLHALPGVDSMVQAVARKHRLIQVAITQNLPLLYSVLKNKEDAISWVSNLQTKFIFANGDAETNGYFSALFGQSKHLMASMSSNNKPFDWFGDSMGLDSGGGNYSTTEHMMPDVRPEAFTRLRKGGKQYGFMVDCYCFQGGRVFSNGKTWVRASIKQML